jgi:quinoprotein glucose dehydrogenase
MRAAAWALLLAVLPALAGAQEDWRTHGGDPGHRQWSPLDQIDRTNVARLQVAWTYRGGDADPANRSQIQCQPIVVKGALYGTTAALKVFALDAATGRERWLFDPFARGEARSPLGVNRGLTYWEEGEDRRILVTAGQKLYALEAGSGRPVATFGNQGAVSLLEGLDRDVAGLYVLSNTPGALYQDLLILGTRVSEGPGASAPGHIRAYDVRTGKVRWIFHTIPHPGEGGYDTWPRDAWTRAGGANAWSGISVDERRGLVFLPVGSAAFDFWGGNRLGANLFSSSVLALDARTGRRVWHYQLVHHDLWDRDPPAAPVLATVRRDGKAVDAVAQVTKQGHVFLFERETGAPLFPIEERRVPASDLEGEVAWPTQPVPLLPPPFARQALTEDLLTTRTPAAHAAVRTRFRGLRSGQPFIPPSTQGTVVFPGFDGGAEWGGAAFDETSGLLYVNANEMPWILTMVAIEPGAAGGRGRLLYRRHCASCHGLDRAGDPQGQYPALTAVNRTRTRAAVDEVVARGKGVMPSFGMLTAAQRRALVGYLFGDAATKAAGGDPPDVTVPYTHTGYNRFLDPDGYPAVKPPWGTLTAIDLNRGTIAWTTPLGQPPGLPPAADGTLLGTENYGGVIVTAGGLLFVAATKDEKFRAFDKATGAPLWETALPAGGYASPATYSVGGRQFVVIAAGGGKMGTRSGDSYIAYALP